MSREWERDPEQQEYERKKTLCTKLPLLAVSLWPSFYRYLSDRRLSPGLARANRWFPSYHAGDNRPRIVIPASSHIVGNVYWQARAMEADVEPRYQSPKASRGDAVVVCWPQQGRPISGAAVVEGPMDALAAAEVDHIGIALMGVTPSTDALDLTCKLLGGIMTTLVADSDAIPEMTQVLMYLVHKRLNVRLVEPYPWNDLAEATLLERRMLLGS
jgi:hypothetical protein